MKGNDLFSLVPSQELRVTCQVIDDGVTLILIIPMLHLSRSYQNGAARTRKIIRGRCYAPKCTQHFELRDANVYY